MTPRGFDLEKELVSGMHDPDRQKLFEIYSGHGNAESYRDFPGAFAAGDQLLECPAPTANFLPCCWRAGEIIRERCESEASTDARASGLFEDRELEARGLVSRGGRGGTF